MREHILDVRELDPPGPLQKALEAIEELGLGEFVLLKISRDPVLLYPMLRVQGYSYVSCTRQQSCFDVFIWRANDDEAERHVQAVLSNIE